MVERNKILSFQDLEIWKRSMKLVEDVYQLTKGFPREEVYGLTSQLRRSAVSIPSNIAEGFNRIHTAEFRQFLYVSLGSCSEASTQIMIASRLAYMESKDSSCLLKVIDEISRMIMSLIKKLGNNE